MKPFAHITWRTLLFCVIALVAIAILFSQVERAYTALMGGEKPIDAVLQEVAQRRAELAQGGELPETEKGIVHVLVLGLDARKDWEAPHCDAIHLFSLNTMDWSMDITSVPRGTYAALPRGGTYAPTDWYVANACSFGGLEYGMEQIQKITGVKADYYVTVNFSQVYGILRTFELPTSKSIQWLRHRQSYQIGDPQRSHNQALFMKDLIVGQLNRFRQPAAPTFMYLLYNMVDTDMDFGTAKALLQGYIEARIDEHPDHIRLAMKPYFPVTDYHFDFENPDPQIEALMDRIRPYLSSEDLSGKDLEQYQSEINTFLDEQLKTPEGVEGIVKKQLWLQVEDDATRFDYHYRYMDAYAKQLIARGEKDLAHTKVTDFILEYTALQNEAMVKKGEALLRRVLQ